MEILQIPRPIKKICIAIKNIIYLVYTIYKGDGIMVASVLSDKAGILSDREEECRMSYINFVIHEFPEAYKMSKPEGYRYLKKYGGLDYLREHWWALHIDNQYYAMQSIFDVCKGNGGYL
jgi:hypothetical protein